MDSSARMVCVICECRLLPVDCLLAGPSTNQQTRRSKNVAALKCGHVFHKMCIHKWLKVNSTCPIDRHPIDVQKGDIFDKLYFNEQDTELSDDEEEEEKEKPWYEEYRESIAFAGGAVVGVVVAGLVAMVAGGNEKKKEQERKK